MSFSPDDWQSKFPDMQPVTSAPSMATVNGIGTMAYGRRDYDAETNTYVKTLCFTVVFLPLFAVRFRDIDGNDSPVRCLEIGSEIENRAYVIDEAVIRIKVIE